MKLTGMELTAFLGELSSKSPAPGGGSTAALAGALSSALVAMVAGLTIGKNKYKAHWKQMESTLEHANSLQKELLDLCDQDAEAYNQVSAAFRLPNKAPAQTQIRAEAIQKATQNAAIVPLNTLKTVADLTSLVTATIEFGNPNCITDAAVAAQLIRAAALGASYNIRINLLSLSDQDFVRDLSTQVKTLLKDILKKTSRIELNIESVLSDKS